MLRARLVSIEGLVAPNMSAAYLAYGRLVVREVQRACRAKGGRHFWREVADATAVTECDADGVTVVNTHIAAAQKQFGGPIEAKNVKALTIPISALARGRRAGEFPQHLHTIKSRTGHSILGFDRGRGRAKIFTPLYVLVQKTRPQTPDPFWPSAPKAKELAAQAIRLAMRAGGAP